MIIEGSTEKMIRGTITVPGDKSITHRAIILGSIATGETKIHNFLDGLDCRSTRTCMQAMGVKMVQRGNSELEIIGKGLHGLQAPRDILYVGNSGTTIRLLSGLLSGQHFCSILDGDDSIRRRPMKRVTQPLSLMNAQIEGLLSVDFAPLSIIGSKLRGVEYTLPVASAQVKSAILLAGLYASGETIIHEPVLTRDHTERMLAFMQADIQSFSDQKIRIKPGTLLKGVNISIPGDISSAAYFLAAACTRRKSEITIKNVGINPTRIAFINAIREMGANWQFLNKKQVSNEPRADIKVEGAKLTGIKIDKKMIAGMIDELPLVAVIATQAQGKTVVRDAKELRVKETDRIKAIVDGLSRIGAKIIERDDGFEVFGPTELTGGTVESYHDHRIAMSMAIAAFHAQGKTVIKDAQCIDVSYPNFFQTYHTLIH